MKNRQLVFGFMSAAAVVLAVIHKSATHSHQDVPCGLLVVKRAKKEHLLVNDTSYFGFGTERRDRLVTGEDVVSYRIRVNADLVRTRASQRGSDMLRLDSRTACQARSPHEAPIRGPS
jgi:hypothetical protein